MKILLFAAARQRVGEGTVDLDIALPASIADLRSALIARYPDLTSLIATSRWAIDESFVDQEATVRGNEEVALIPPVSGG